MDNMELWNKVCKTDPQHTKKANVRGNNITAIAPQSQIMKATEMFGPYGAVWGFSDIKLDFSMLEQTGIVVFKGNFYYSIEGSGRQEFPIISSISAYKDGARTKPDHDFAKKVETDALTKALSKIGFNADIFMGLYDDVKYVDEMKQEFTTFVVDDTAKQWIKAIQDGASKIEEINDLKYRTFIMEQLK